MVDYVEWFIGKLKKNKFIAVTIVLFLSVIYIGDFLEGGTAILNLINGQSDEA